MILKTKQFKEACSKILSAIDKENNTLGLTELVELNSLGDILYMNVTNGEYYVSLKFKLDKEENFKATISAGVFLKLISQLTTEEIEIKSNTHFISIKSNGNYKIPIIYDNDKMMELPKISIDNPTVEMPIDSEILKSILYYNSKELLKGTMANPTIQKLHYIDDQGALTFTTGACVNSFVLPKPIKLLIGNKIVKLFKLFEEDSVNFTLGYDSISDSVIVTKIKLETDSTVLTAILNCDNSLLKQVPVTKIRARAEKVYPYTVTIDKNHMIQALNRLLVFINNSKVKNLKSPSAGKFVFTKGEITISDLDGENVETIQSMNFTGEEYSCLLDLEDLKSTLDTCIDTYLNISFGDREAIVVSRLNVSNILSECDIS